ncbi:MAG: hypothetical protein FD160_4147, partial [Caulobacteraceae bacterium]
MRTALAALVVLAVLGARASVARACSCAFAVPSVNAVDETGTAPLDVAPWLWVFCAPPTSVRMTTASGGEVAIDVVRHEPTPGLHA